MKRDDDVMIWTENGTWLQTRQGEVVRSSYVGRLSLVSVESFCRERGVKLMVGLKAAAAPEAKRNTVSRG